MAEPRLRPWTASEERVANVVIKAMTAANTWVYRLTGGRVGGKFRRGVPVCRATTWAGYVGILTGRVALPHPRRDWPQHRPHLH